jgi:hypothetical protein
MLNNSERHKLVFESDEEKEEKKILKYFFNFIILANSTKRRI